MSRWKWLLVGACGLAAACTTGETSNSSGDGADTVQLDDSISGDDTVGTDCADSCEGKGQTRCGESGVETCGDHDGDGCIEWGAATPCPGELACVDGECAVSCQDECEIAGGKQCGEANAVQTCKDHDADGCLEWGGDVECVGGLVCKSGFCSTNCEGDNECTVQGATKCEGAAIVGCTDQDFDGCLEWSAPNECPPGQSCSNGACASTCSDECTVVGARQCDGTGGYVVCNEHDQDGCLEWGGKTDCTAGDVCSNGFCAKECANECTVAGASKCNGNAVQVCADLNDDGCLEWGTSDPCDAGLVCANGHCTVDCTDECTVSGAKTCEGDAVKTCGDANSDGCLEWGTPAACGEGQTCSSGQCAETCSDECSVVGAEKCLGDAIQVCGDSDADSCLEWGTATPCDSDEVCSSGACLAECQDECTTAGASACEGNAVKTCQQTAGGCLEWSVPTACPGTETCSAGTCSEICVDECSVVGAKKCEGDAVSQCGNTDPDPCLEWGTPDACDNGQTCSGGFCTALCADECTVQGAKKCFGEGFAVCDDYDTDGCLEWGTTTPCGEGQSCSAGNCASTCSDECTAGGAKQCDGNGVQTCGDVDSDPCLEWGTAAACENGLICVAGNCALSCTDECTVVGARKCSGEAAWQECADSNEDGCLEWGTASGCAPGEVCSAGNCALTCSDECDVAGQKQCNPAGTGLQTCDDHDSDGCLEWSSDVPCGDGQACSGGSCAATCSDECSSDGASKCTAGGVQVCGDYNDDGCLQWGTAVACKPAETCQDGACQAGSVPGVVKINEILYDDVGGDDTTFVELKGDPGLALDGFVLAAVNGYDGSTYAEIVLTGEISDDGFFVVASSTANAQVAAATDQTADTNFQNGPDAVQVRWASTVVDAVAYGDSPGGEGNHAQDVSGGTSLGRDAQGTDTDDNANDFVAYDEWTPGAPNGAANTPPTAVLSCPSGGSTGEDVLVDAAGSSDADGTIVIYELAWGDGFQAEGPSSSGSHAYASPGNFTITLTVVDDGGAAGTDTCTVAISDSNAPKVGLLKPAADLQVTQGQTVAGILADVTPAPGRSIVGTQLTIDGQPVGSVDDSAPYTFDYTVPVGAETGSTILLRVQATDDQGAVGSSPARKLLVKNDPPVAAMTAVITGNLEVTADGSGSSDTETPTAELEVRFDWENDGTWDTAWSTQHKATHTYASDGEHTLAMIVRDDVGQTSTVTRTVNFQSVQDVAGTIESTLWYGTINVTGDLVVPAGETLTIAPGTTVVFLEFDQGSDGTGDFDMDVQGTLIIEGTASEPVIVTTFDTDGLNDARAWNRIRLAPGSSGHLIEHAIFEYADVALDIRGSATLSAVTLRNNRRGIEVHGVSAGVSLTDVWIEKSTDVGLWANQSKITALGFTSTLNGGTGVSVAGGSGTQFTDCDVSGNGVHGFYLNGTHAGVAECAIEDNSEVGVFYQGNSTGLMTHTVIRGNGYEGVRAVWGDEGNPEPSIRYNEILENGAKGSMVRTTVSISVDSNYSSTSDPTSELYSVPGGGRVLLARVAYDEDTSSSLSGRLLNQAGSTLKTFSTDTGASWQDVTDSGATGLRVRVVDDTQYGDAKITLHDVVHTGGEPGKQLTTFLTSGTVDARYNYFGVWPNVLDVVTYETAAHLDIEGFVGVPYDAAWSTGPYVGGVTFSEDVVWDHDVYVTGNVALAAGATLTIEPGVTVTFVPTDQDGNLQGDWSIDRAAGTLDAAGTSGAVITFDVLGETVPELGGFRFVHGNGAGTTTLVHAVIRDGGDCLRVAAGTLNVTDTLIQDCRESGLVVSGSGAAHLLRTNVLTSTIDGIELSGTGTSSFDDVLLDGNGRWGLRAVSAGGANTMINSTLTDNTAGGAYVRSSQLALSQSHLKFNGYGVWIAGSASGSVTSSDILYNDLEGVFATQWDNAHPSMSVTGCNIFGNTIEAQATVSGADLSADSSYSSTSDVTSAAWSAPEGHRILFVQASYDEDTSSSLSGQILLDGTVLKQLGTDTGSSWYTVDDQKAFGSVAARVVDDTQYGDARMRVHDVVHTMASDVGVEMTVFFTSGVFIATGNHWGVTVPTTTQAVELMPATADYTQFKTTQISGTGPK